MGTQIESKERLAGTVDQFIDHLQQKQNFLIGRECIHFEMDFPPVEEVVDILRRDEMVKVRSKGPVDPGEEGRFAEWVKTAPLREVLERGGWGLTHFELNRFYGQGQFLFEFQDRVMIPWRTFLAQNGFTWQRCAPYIFISAHGVSSDYHADFSHVMAWQLDGVKVFNGFLDPDKYAPIAECVRKDNGLRSKEPPAYDAADLLCYRMEKGDLLWNQLLTPHWVVAGEDRAAMSVNISHGGLRYRGQFLANEVPLRRRWEEHPEEAWVADLRY